MAKNFGARKNNKYKVISSTPSVKSGTVEAQSDPIEASNTVFVNCASAANKLTNNSKVA